MTEHEELLRAAAACWLDQGNTPYYGARGAYSTSGNEFLGDAEHAVLDVARARGLDQPILPTSRTAIPTWARAEVVARSGGRCEWVYMGGRCDEEAGLIHHRHPWAEGGGHEPDNLLHFCGGHHKLVHSPDGQPLAVELGFLE